MRINLILMEVEVEIIARGSVPTCLPISGREFGYLKTGFEYCQQLPPCDRGFQINMAGFVNGQTTQYTTWSTNVVAPQAMTMTHVAPPPEDYTGRALFAIFCCFWPLGLFALIKASEAKKSYRMGDSEMARSQADQARQLSNISIIVGIVSFVVLIIFIIIYYITLSSV